MGVTLSLSGQSIMCVSSSLNPLWFALPIFIHKLVADCSGKNYVFHTCIHWKLKNQFKVLLHCIHCMLRTLQTFLQVLITFPHCHKLVTNCLFQFQEYSQGIKTRAKCAYWYGSQVFFILFQFQLILFYSIFIFVECIYCGTMLGISRPGYRRMIHK